MRKRASFAAMVLAMAAFPSGLAGLFQGPPPPPPPPPPQQSRDSRPAEAAIGTGSITGTVTVADSGQAARRVRVTLSGSELRGGRTAMSDDGGRFSFVSLPAGRYTLAASKPGHVNVTFGQRRPGAGRPGTPIQLADGQTMQVQLQIPRGGVITGIVLDEHGEAIPGTPVRVLRYVTQNGYRTLQGTGNAGSTDDRGVYRIYGLQPGDYIVMATPRNSGPGAEVERIREEVERMRERMDVVVQRDAVAARALADRLANVQAGMAAQTEETNTGYAPVFYPGTTTPSTAGTVAVGVGEEKVGVDFQLQLVPIARVEGVVTVGSGPLPGNIQVSLVNLGHEMPGVGSNSARADGDGRFRLTNVAPGQYMLVARGTFNTGRGGGRGQAAMAATPAGRAAAIANAVQQAEDAVRLWAMADLTVDGRHVSNIVLTLQPGMTIGGRIVFEGTTPPPADLTRLRATASPVDIPGPQREIMTSASGRVDATGRFTISNVVPGRYRITVSGGQPWTIASSVVSGQDTMDVPLEVKPNQSVSNVVVTFTDRQNELTGTIVNDQAQPAPEYTIILYAADREFWTPGSRRILSARPATDGRFIFRNLPPGDYRIAPVLDPEPGSWFDPAFLQQLDANALRVPMGEGEKKVQNLRVSAQ